MNIITFPAINLKIQISKIAFSINNIDIYWYAILIVSAIIIDLIIFKIRDGKFGIKFENVLDLCIFLIPISIICARVYFILFNLSYYISNPIQIFNLRNGGLAIYGGIIRRSNYRLYILYKKKNTCIRFV